MRLSAAQRRRSGLGMAVVALALAVTACGGGSTINTSSASSGSSTGTAASGSATSAGASTQGGWVIGSLVDETGTDANGGAAQQKGIEYLVKQINGSGGIRGHHISIKFCDTQSTPSGAAQCAQQLSGVNTHLVLATGASSVVAQAMVAGVKAAGLHTIGVLYTTDTSGTHQLQAAQAAAAKAGLKVVSEAQNPGANDVTPQLVKLRSDGAQAIYLASVGTNTAAAVNSYRTLGISQPVIVGAAAVTNGFLHSLPSIPAHLYGVSQLLASSAGLPPATAKAFSTFLAQFKAQEGEPADTQNTSAVYVGCVASAALKAAGPSVRGMAAFLRTEPISCLGSTMRFNIPGLNVVSGQPAALVQAGPSAAAGWGPVRGKL